MVRYLTGIFMHGPKEEGWLYNENRRFLEDHTSNTLILRHTFFFSFHREIAFIEQGTEEISIMGDQQ